MHPANLVRSLVVCAILYFTSAAPTTSTPTIKTTAPTQKPYLKVVTASTITSNNHSIDLVSNELSTNVVESGPRFLADTGESDGDLTNNEAFYIGVILLANAAVFFGVIFYLLTPWMRVCSWFNNCKYNSANGYYPSGVGYSMDDAARMLSTFNMPVFSYDRKFSKRSLEYVAPILKTLAEAYDRYETSSSTTKKNN